jgi:hypothetical protein
MPNVTYEYDVPEALQDTAWGKITTICVRELRPEDEMIAAKRAGGDSTAMAFQLAKMSLVRINDTAITTADESADRAWRDIGPKLRNLVIAAYGEANMAGESDSRNFLKTKKTKVT